MWGEIVIRLCLQTYITVIVLCITRLGTTYAERIEYDTIHAQCHCTCPIEKVKLQAAVKGYTASSDSMLHDGPYSDDTTYMPTTVGVTATPTPPVTTAEGSGYYIDDNIAKPASNVYPGSGDLGINIDKYTQILSDLENPDDEVYGQPLTANSPSMVSVGEKGEKGDIGLLGVPGIIGKTGADGAKGEAGLDGNPGGLGPKGSKGDKGDSGPRGYNGNVGLQGYRGPPGPMGETGRPGARGSDGPRGIRGERGNAGQRGMLGLPGLKGEAGEPGLPGEPAPASSSVSGKVAFLARLRDHFGPSSASSHLIYPQVDFNVGSGFDPSTGSFVVEIEGLYVFHLQVMAMADYIAWLAIKVNGEPVAYAWASGYSSSTEQMGTAMTMQQLKRGDTVNVIQKASDNPPNYLYAHYTLFSGYLLG